nr:MAG TPA: hypothetical protein [Caudoviricetes sp.]DAQ94471.1 MAG TPA: hypothetical protein [Caudoviricetes sp.]
MDSFFFLYLALSNCYHFGVAKILLFSHINKLNLTIFYVYY